MKKMVSFEGGYGFGKSTVLNYFANQENVQLFPSITKEVYNRIDTWYNPPVQFTDTFFQIRKDDYTLATASDKSLILFDRFLFAPIVLRIFCSLPVPSRFMEFCEQCRLDQVIIMDPIPLENYENGFPRKNVTYEESLEVQQITLDIVKQFGYNPIHIPYDTVENRYEKVKNELIL